jgi:hypothetical protein
MERGAVHALNRRTFLRNTAAGVAGGLALPLVSAAPAGATGEGTTFTGCVNDGGGQVFNVTNPAYGAKGDTMRAAASGRTTQNTTEFSHTAQGNGDTSGEPAAPIVFDAATDVGKVLTIQGAGVNGAVFSTTIQAVVNATTVTMAAPAPTAVTAAEFSYGSDDTAAIVAAIAAAGETGTLYFPGGIYTIRGGSNGGLPITYTGRGGMRGRGGTFVPNAGVGYREPNTIFLAADATAGFLLNGCARYESFMCDGNRIAAQPLQVGTVVANQVVEAPSHATFIDVLTTGSTATGWAIYGAQSCSFHSCGTTYNATDGIYIDGGASNLHFFHFEEFGNLRYGIHGDHVVKTTSGSTGPSTGVRFLSGLCDGAGTLGQTVSKVYLRGAVDWRFPEMIMVASNLGPTVDLDQSSGHSLDFSDTRIIGGGQDGTGNDVSIQISGTPPDDTVRTFIKVGGGKYTQAVNSISILGQPRKYRYSAVGGWWDGSTAGPGVATGLPPVDTLFPGRTGPWQTATVVAPWSGTVTYRIMGEDWVQLAGSVKCTGVGSGTAFTLPAGYRPSGAGHRMLAGATSASAVIVISAAGVVTVNPVAGGTFPTNTTVSLEGLAFPVDRA